MPFCSALRPSPPFTVVDAQAQANPEVAEILAKIDVLEKQRDRLFKSKYKAESDLDLTQQRLRSMADSIANVDAYIASAQAAFDAADNDEERADWAAVIADLNQYRQKLLYQYNSIAYTIHLLESRINTLAREIADIENQLMALYARLFELI